MISANTIAINMTSFPKESVEEGSVAEYMCETNWSDCTDPPAVIWFVDEESVNASDVHTIETYSSSTSRKSTKSTMTFIADRMFNNKQVKCILGNGCTKFNEHTLNVTCRYISPHV